MHSILSKARKLVKEHESDILLGIAVAILVFLAFGLGFLVARHQLKEPIRVQMNENQ
ncbi:MAG: hypothetical protein HYT50_02600 [Candidatus Wildermuthbacteria bacterium]|nr:hypothetical protein [Candidatus Wildermuthbacteria bacterium]